MDRWAVLLSGPETVVNSMSQPFQACMHGKGGDMGLHAREADVHACERGELGELGGHARIDSELGHCFRLRQWFRLRQRVRCTRPVKELPCAVI